MYFALFGTVSQCCDATSILDGIIFWGGIPLCKKLVSTRPKPLLALLYISIFDGLVLMQIYALSGIRCFVLWKVKSYIKISANVNVNGRKDQKVASVYWNAYSVPNVLHLLQSRWKINFHINPLIWFSDWRKYKSKYTILKYINHSYSMERANLFLILR